MLKHTKQKGLSLIELMIGLLVGTVVAGGAISVFTNSIKSGTDNTELARLNQDMRAIMDIMVRDIRRAGYAIADPATSPSTLTNNPFQDSLTAGATTDIAVYDDGSCIVYSYNRNDDSPPVVSADERLGFKLNNGAITMRTSGDTNENCDNNNNSWQSITGPEVEVTALAFNVTEAELSATKMLDGTGDDDDDGSCETGEACNACDTGDKCLYIRNVTLSLTARLSDDNTVTQTINGVDDNGENVRVRNDKYVQSAP